MAKLFRGSPAQTVVLALALAIFLSSAGGLGGLTLLSSGDLGYSTGFQGPKAKFYGVKYNGQQFTSISLAAPQDGGTTGDTSTGSNQGASLAKFDTTLAFDPDVADGGKPNVVGEMTSVFVPEESLSNMILWPGAKAIPQDWFKRAAVIQNPQQTYSWNISSKTYKMEQWVLRFYMSFSGEWDGVEWKGSQYPYYSDLAFGQIVRNNLVNTEVWLQFDLTPTWYIEGGGTAYFAIGKVQVAEFKKTAHDIQGNEVELDTQMSVSPESEGAIMYVYYGPWGVSSAEREASYYQGKQLNPDLFTKKVYAHFDLNNFGVTAWNRLGTAQVKGDVATIAFDITVFMIGEWDVKDIQSIPEDFGRTAKTYTPASFLDYLGDPRVQALLALLAGAGLLLLLIVVAPGFLIAVLAIFMGSRKRR